MTPRRGPISAWLLAVRPKTLSAAAVPVLMGSALAAHEPPAITWWVFACALLGAVLIQIATNLIKCESDLEPLAVAKVLKALCEEEKPGLVLMGKQAIDDDCNQTGQMLAALLNWPPGTCASKLEIVDGRATVTREVDGGLQTIELTLPAVVTADLRLNEPRYASLPNIMKARKKPIAEKSIADFGVDTKPRLTILDVREPAKRRSGVRVASAAELVGRLREAGAL